MTEANYNLEAEKSFRVQTLKMTGNSFYKYQVNLFFQKIIYIMYINTLPPPPQKKNNNKPHTVTVTLCTKTSEKIVCNEIRRFSFTGSVYQ